MRIARMVSYVLITILFICGNSFVHGGGGRESSVHVRGGQESSMSVLCQVSESLFGEFKDLYTEYGDLDGIWYEIREGRAIITGYEGEAEELVLPAEIKGFPVTEIGQNAFGGNTHLKSVVSEGSIKTIGAGAFVNCSALETAELGEEISEVGTEVFKGTKYYAAQQPGQGYVTIGNMLLAAPLSGEFLIPEGVTAVGPYCFRDNENVTEVILPEGMLYLNEGAFYGCTNMTKVSFPAGMEEIGGGAFQNCGNLTEITFRGSVRRIGDSAFEGCENYGDITFPEGLEEIGARAFWGCGQMNSVVIPGTVKKIGEGAFCDPDGLWTPRMLSRLELKEGVERVDRQAFLYVTAQELLLPGSLISVGEDAFTVTEEMETAPGMYVADGVLLRYTGEEGIPTVPEEVTMILGYAFRYNNNLISVNLPEGLKTIGNNAFEGCGELSYLSIPESVEALGDRAFADCPNLTIAEGWERVERTGAEVFDGSGVITDK